MSLVKINKTEQTATISKVNVVIAIASTVLLLNVAMNTNVLKVNKVLGYASTHMGTLFWIYADGTAMTYADGADITYA